MASELFAWEGFSFLHSEDWAPITLSGRRREGYVRMAGSGRIGCQIRWQSPTRTPSLPEALLRYRQLLARDARKSRAAFSFESQAESDEVLIYRWLGSGQGRGALRRGPCGRLFFIEVTGGRSDSLLPLSRSLLDSFQSESGNRLEPWSLFGMTIRLPKGLSPAQTTLQSGRTWLLFRPRFATIEAGRVAFGRELVARHGLDAWARSALRMTSATILEEEQGLRLAATRWGRPVSALVRLDDARNQILCVRSTGRAPKWTPEWDWLASDD